MKNLKKTYFHKRVGKSAVPKCLKKKKNTKYLEIISAFIGVTNMKF